jgi:hypothetical protein
MWSVCFCAIVLLEKKGHNIRIEQYHISHSGNCQGFPEGFIESLGVLT